VSPLCWPPRYGRDTPLACWASVSPHADTYSVVPRQREWAEGVDTTAPLPAHHHTCSSSARAAVANMHTYSFTFVIRCRVWYGQLATPCFVACHIVRTCRGGIARCGCARVPANTPPLVFRIQCLPSPIQRADYPCCVRGLLRKCCGARCPASHHPLSPRDNDFILAVCVAMRTQPLSRRRHRSAVCVCMCEQGNSHVQVLGGWRELFFRVRVGG
jgi:hypothetical protein